MKIEEVTCVNKIYSDNKRDTFEYRNMYNDVKTIDFPSSWSMTIEDVEKYLSTNQEVL